MADEKSIEDVYKFLCCLNTKIDKSQETLNDIKLEVSGLSAKVIKLEEENITLKTQINTIDRRLRKNNVIVFGLETKDVSESLQKLSQTLDIPLDLSHFNNIYFIPSKNNQLVLKLEFISYLAKSELLGHLYKLKNTKIYITNDLNAEDQLTQKTLRGFLNTAKKNGKKATIRSNHLIIDSKKYTIADLYNTPGILNSEDTTEDKKRKNLSSSPDTEVESVKRITRAARLNSVV